MGSQILPPPLRPVPHVGEHGEPCRKLPLTLHVLRGEESVDYRSVNAFCLYYKPIIITHTTIAHVHIDTRTEKTIKQAKTPIYKNTFEMFWLVVVV